MFLVAVGALMLLSTTFAQSEYPNRRVTMIAPYGEGGGVDIIARTIAPFLSDYLGEPVVVENRPGAGGEVGYTHITNVEPDGYTIGWIATPTVASIPIERDAQYSLSDFALISNLVDDPTTVTVRGDSPYATFEELLAHIRENPGSVTVGGSAIGAQQHFLVEIFAQQYDVEMVYIPFQSSGHSTAAVLGGHVTVSADTIGNVSQYVEEGTMRTLAVAAEERHESMPDVPTLSELGFDIMLSSQRGMVAPPGTPQEIIDRLLEAVEHALENEEFQAQAEQRGILLRPLPPEEWREELNELEVQVQELWDTNPWIQ